jgi:hypothetical protein
MIKMPRFNHRTAAVYEDLDIQLPEGANPKGTKQILR